MTASKVSFIGGAALAVCLALGVEGARGAGRDGAAKARDASTDAGQATDGGPARVEMVRVQVLVDPPQKAHVFWGIKDLGVAPLELERPRGSGPLDLILKAPGYLVVHTRAFTEHDDKIVVRLTPSAR